MSEFEVIHTLPTGHQVVARKFRHLGQSGVEVRSDIIEGDRRAGMAVKVESFDALAIWWLKKNPALLGQVLSEEQRGALEYAVAACKASEYKHRREYGDVLEYILSPKEG